MLAEKSEGPELHHRQGRRGIMAQFALKRPHDEWEHFQEFHGAFKGGLVFFFERLFHDDSRHE